MNGREKCLGDRLQLSIGWLHSPSHASEQYNPSHPSCGATRESHPFLHCTQVTCSILAEQVVPGRGGPHVHHACIDLENGAHTILDGSTTTPSLPHFRRWWSTTVGLTCTTQVPLMYLRSCDKGRGAKYQAKWSGGGCSIDHGEMEGLEH